jgi:hypothetical protein
MKKLIACLMFVMPLMSYAQVSDDFSDGDFTNSPEWEGDTSKFEVNGSKQLHLWSAGTDTSFLSTGNSRIAETEWNFWVKISFNTSANNFARIYLVSDNADLGGPLNGYYLQIGGSNDSLTFKRQTGSSSQILIRGNKTFTGNSTNILRIKVIHDDAGIWQLFSDNSGGTNYQKEGEEYDESINSTSWFGVLCRYTSSNSTKFYFDDFYAGPIHVDTIPPAINKVNLLDDHHLEILFTENIDKTTVLDLSNYNTYYNGIPSAAFCDSLIPGRVVLTFPGIFITDTCDSILVRNIKDLENNAAGLLTAQFCNWHEKAFDVVINEIMADPDPPEILPDAEYVELFNRTGYPIPLKDWIFESGSSRKVLPDVTINARGFIILTKGNLFSAFGTSVDLFTSSSFLSNEGSTLGLRNKEGRVIHSVTYATDWYQNSLKANGGWSLEMIDPANPCGCADNWKATVDGTGGTPGRVNSVFDSNKDTIEPRIQRAIPQDLETVKVIFSEAMDSLSLIVHGKWLMVNESEIIDSITLISPDFSMLELHLPVSLQKGTIYTILPGDSIYDCAGNPLLKDHSVRVAIPDSIEPNDIVVNEILSNPATDGERFIELYNRSDKILDYRDLVLASFDTLAGEPSDIVAAAEDGYLSFPGDYAVLTVDPSEIKKRYFTPNPDGFLTLSKMPSFGNDAGIVVIAKKSDQRIVDLVKYSKDMQFALLSATDGVSLERISPARPSDEKDNWHSAGSACGFATPGYLNSQFTNPGETGNTISVSPDIFTPDNDGKNDVLTLQIHPENPGFMGSVSIFDSKGRFVRQLIKNQLLSDLNIYTWDGTDENGRKSSIGIHLLYCELVNPDGKVRRIKKAIVLGGKL